MKEFRIRLSEGAIGDILEQADWYEERGDPKVSKRWEHAVSVALLRIARHPRSGALCKFKAEELAKVRWVLVSGFPKHLLFYQLHENEAVVLRIIHGARDLESLL